MKQIILLIILFTAVAFSQIDTVIIDGYTTGASIKNALDKTDSIQYKLNSEDTLSISNRVDAVQTLAQDSASALRSFIAEQIANLQQQIDYYHQSNPAAPTDLAIATGAVLTWAKSATLGVDSTIIYRSTDNITFVQEDHVAQAIETYDDTTTSGTQYYYYVKAKLGDVYSNPSNTATFKDGGVWYVDRDATGDGLGRSWANAATSLTSLFSSAAIAGSDTVYISGGEDSTTYGCNNIISKIFSSDVVVTKGWESGHNGDVYFVNDDTMKAVLTINALL